MTDINKSVFLHDKIMPEIVVPPKYIHLPEWVDPKPFERLPLLLRHVVTAMANEYSEPDNIFFNTDDMQRLLHGLCLVEGYEKLLVEEHRNWKWGRAWAGYPEVSTGISYATFFPCDTDLTRGYLVADKTVFDIRADILKASPYPPFFLTTYINSLDHASEYIQGILLRRRNPPRFETYPEDPENRRLRLYYQRQGGLMDIWTAKYDDELVLPRR